MGKLRQVDTRIALIVAITHSRKEGDANTDGSAEVGQKPDYRKAL